MNHMNRNLEIEMKDVEQRFYHVFQPHHAQLPNQSPSLLDFQDIAPLHHRTQGPASAAETSEGSILKLMFNSFSQNLTPNYPN